jgi:hypothetical protein
MTKDEALRVAMDWYGSGNQDPDEFEKLILSIVEQRTWVGLTEDEAFACKGRDYFETYKAIEAKLKDKNEQIKNT